MSSKQLSSWVQDADAAVLKYLAIRPLLTNPLLVDPQTAGVTPAPSRSASTAYSPNISKTEDDKKPAHMEAKEEMEQVHQVVPQRRPSMSTYEAPPALISASLIMVPTTRDVLLGRGEPLLRRPGNVWFRSLIDKRSKEYELASKFAKTRIAEQVVEFVQDASGRFLRQVEKHSGWQEVDGLTARHKVASAFRSHRKERRRLVRTMPKLVRRITPDEVSLQATKRQQQRHEDEVCRQSGDDREAVAGPIVEPATPEQRHVDTERSSSPTVPPVTDPITTVILHPRPNDVLCGRGRHVNKHTGNLALRRLVMEQMDTYDRLPKIGKHCFSLRIVSQVKSINGRFLKAVDETCDTWEEISDAEARIKVATAFRSARKGMKRHQDRQDEEFEYFANPSENVD